MISPGWYKHPDGRSRYWDGNRCDGSASTASGGVVRDTDPPPAGYRPSQEDRDWSMDSVTPLSRLAPGDRPARYSGYAGAAATALNGVGLLALFAGGVLVARFLAPVFTVVALASGATSVVFLFRRDWRRARRFWAVTLAMVMLLAIGGGGS